MNSTTNNKKKFENSIGSLYNTTIIINSLKKKELVIEEIAFIEIMKVNKNTINVILGITGIATIIAGFVLERYFEFFFILGILIIGIGVIKKFESLYMQIIFKIPNRIVLPLSKSQINEANQLIREFNMRQSTLLR